jgi:hypothetical protein
VVGEAVVALDGDCLLRRVSDWPSGSWFEEYDDRLEDCVAGAAEGVPVAEAEACDARATASCHGWAQVAGYTARVQVPRVLDKKRAGVRSSHYSSCWVQAAYAPDLRPLSVGHEHLQTR